MYNKVKVKRTNRYLGIISKGGFNDLGLSEKSYIINFLTHRKNGEGYDSATYALQRVVYIVITLMFAMLVLFDFIKIGLDFVEYEKKSTVGAISIKELDNIVLGHAPTVVIYYLGALIFYSLYKKAKIRFYAAKYKEGVSI